MAQIELRGKQWSIRFLYNGKYVRLTKPEWNVENNNITKRYMNSIAERECAKYKADMELKANFLTAHQVITDFMEYIDNKSKHNTYINYLSLVNKYIQPFINNEYELSNVVFNKDFFYKVRVALMKSNSKVSAKNMLRSRLFNFYDYLQLLNQVDANTILKEKALIPVFKDNEIDERNNFWDEEEWNRFINSIPIDSEMRLMFEVCYYEGLRCGELLGLEFRDFNFDRNTLTITRQLGQDKKISSPKTKASNATIFVPHELCKKIKDLQIRYNAKDTDFLFFPDEHIMPMQLKYKFQNCINRVDGLKRITIHGLRHSCASALINEGYSILAISKHLRHESPDITLKKYAHLFAKNDVNLVDSIYDKNHK